MTYRRRVILFTAATIVLAACGLTPVRASAASLFFSPSSGSYSVGQSFTVTVKVNASGQPMNAAEGTVTWNSNVLRLASLSSSGTIFKYWPIDPVARGASTALFSGGVPSPGYSGSSGTIMRLNFVAQAAGTGTLQFSGAKILANDGYGTNIFSGSGTATFTVVASTSKPAPPPTTSIPSRPTPVISSSTHPDQSAWYRASDITLSWTRPSGLLGVSYILTADPDTIPDEQRDTTGTTADQTLSSDGTWYFHLRGEYAGGWSGTAHYAIHFDRTPPPEFTLVFDTDHGPTSASPTVTFSVTDVTSGVITYTSSIDGSPAAATDTTLMLEGLRPGEHHAVVTATDRAGNSRQADLVFTIVGYAAPTITSVSSPLLLLDPLVVRGIANIGDRITIYINGQAVGEVVAGPTDTAAEAGIAVRAPWTVTVDQLFRPGTYQVTATATSRAGQVSSITDPRPLHVSGQAILLNGRPVATLSVVTPIVILAVSLLALILSVMVKLGVSVWSMHRRVRVVEEELESIRLFNEKQSLSRQQLNSVIDEIEADLEGTDRPKRRRPVRRTTTRRAR